MVTPATRERHRFADELLAVGPDAPTLCDPWTARDLAAHIVLRDRRPDAAPGVLVSRFAGYTQKVQDRIAAGDWGEIVDAVRHGPPAFSPTRIAAVDRLVNTTEFFVHCEDVRRAQPGWSPRELDSDLVHDLRGALGRVAPLLTRKAPAGIRLVPDDGSSPIVARRADATVDVRGPVGELVLWVFGRQAHARVDYEGDAADIEALRSARFGI